MPVIPLRDQRKAYLGGVEQTGMFLNGVKTWAKPASSPYPWTNVVPVDGGPTGGSTGFRGVVSVVDGAYRVTTAAGQTNGRALVNMPVMDANTRILLEYSLLYGTASRLICRQVESNDSTGGITVFDVTKPTGATTLIGSNNFLVVTNRRLLHFIGVTATGGYFTINPQTRWRLNPSV